MGPAIAAGPHFSSAFLQDQEHQNRQDDDHQDDEDHLVNWLDLQLVAHLGNGELSTAKDHHLVNQAVFSSEQASTGLPIHDAVDAFHKGITEVKVSSEVELAKGGGLQFKTEDAHRPG